VPEAIVPAVQTGGPPAEGTGRLVVDVTDGPAPVQRVVLEPQPFESNGRRDYVLVEKPHELCPHAPCVANLPVGNILLGFPVIGNDDLESELVHVGPEPSVYRRTLSVYTPSSGAEYVLGIIGTALGGTSLVTGTVFLPIGLAKDNTGLTTAGAVTLGAGALLLTIGILMIHGGAPTYRPGASNHFPLAAP
jgi:hypothetical protein